MMESTGVTLDPSPIHFLDPSDYRPELTDTGKDKPQFRIFKVLPGEPEGYAVWLHVRYSLFLCMLSN